VFRDYVRAHYCLGYDICFGNGLRPLLRQVQTIIGADLIRPLLQPPCKNTLRRTSVNQDVLLQVCLNCIRDKNLPSLSTSLCLTLIELQRRNLLQITKHLPGLRKRGPLPSYPLLSPETEAAPHLRFGLLGFPFLISSCCDACGLRAGRWAM
jgi:hypothetical protein